MKNAPDMNLKKEIAQRIRQIRMDADLSQAGFAASINVSRVHLNRMEAPDIEMMPSQPVLNRLCKTYHVNTNWIMTGQKPIYCTPNVEKEDDIELSSSEDIVGINMSMVNNTISFVNLQTSSLLKRGKMTSASYVQYFQTFSSLIDLLFNLMRDIKECYEKKEHLPDVLQDDYCKRFKDILNKK